MIRRKGGWRVNAAASRVMVVKKSFCCQWRRGEAMLLPIREGWNGRQCFAGGEGWVVDNTINRGGGLGRGTVLLPVV